MKVNIIYHDFSSNVIIDAEILNFILKKFKEKPVPVNVNVNNYQCEEAEINIFLEKINYCYFNKAKYNIFIPNQQYFHKNQIEFLNCFDVIFCKSKYILEVFKSYVHTDKLKYIGWRSPDIYIPSVHKSYNDYLIFYQDANYYPLQDIIDLWQPDYPYLNIILQVNRKDLNLKTQDKDNKSSKSKKTEKKIIKKSKPRKIIKKKDPIKKKYNKKNS